MPAWTLLFLVQPDSVHDLTRVLQDWRDDSFEFLRYSAPRILAMRIGALILARLLKVAARHLGELGSRQFLPSAVRTQQIRTLSHVIYSVGLFIIVFLAAMQILTQLNIKVEPLLARPT